METGDNMKVLLEEKIKVLAEANSWSPVFAQGFLEGETARRRGTLPSKYAQIGIDQFCLGFRAGYYDRRIARSSVPVAPAAATGRTSKVSAKNSQDKL